MNFFTADSHFSKLDETIITRDFRPFESLEKMNEEIIKIWNVEADSNDIIYHLGDFVNYNSFDNKNYEECFGFVKKIKAKLVLILGNNENKILARVKKYLLFSSREKNSLSQTVGDL